MVETGNASETRTGCLSFCVICFAERSKDAVEENRLLKERELVGEQESLLLDSILLPTVLGEAVFQIRQ